MAGAHADLGSRLGNGLQDLHLLPGRFNTKPLPHIRERISAPVLPQSKVRLALCLIGGLSQRRQRQVTIGIHHRLEQLPPRHRGHLTKPALPGLFAGLRPGRRVLLPGPYAPLTPAYCGTCRLLTAPQQAIVSSQHALFPMARRVRISSRFHSYRSPSFFYSSTTSPPTSGSAPAQVQELGTRLQPAHKPSF